MSGGRIAYLLTAFPTITETFVEGEIRSLIRRGFAIDLYATRNFRQAAEGEDPAADRGLEVARLPFLFHPEVAGATLALLLRRPHRVLVALAAVVWGNLASPRYLLHALALFPKSLAFALRMERRETRHLHGTWAHYPATCAYVISRVTGIPFSFSAHAGLDVLADPTFLGEKIRRAKFVLTCNEANRQVLLRDHPSAADRLQTVYHGVDLGGIPPPGKRDGEPAILSVGRLAEEKGFLDLLEAAAHLKQRGIPFRLRIFGEGPQRPELEAAIERLGLATWVRLEGVAPHRRILEACAEASVVALASYPGPQRFQDGIANILVEAMACGTPVVSTEYAGSRELLEGGRWGALVPPREPGRLAAALEELLRDPERREELGRQGRIRVERSFDRERNMELIAARFREALAGGDSSAD